MKTDLYTKAVLTVIAVALLPISLNTVPRTIASEKEITCIGLLKPNSTEEALETFSNPGQFLTDGNENRPIEMIALAQTWGSKITIKCEM